MPSVPRYNGNQVQEQAAPRVKAGPEADLESFGGGQSSAQAFNAIGGLAKTGEDIYKAERDKADKLVVTDAAIKAKRLKADLLYNQKTGAMTKTGAAAFGVSDEYSPQFRKGLDEIEAGLSTPEQKALFSQIKQTESLDLDDTLQKHTFTEGEKYKDDTLKAGIEVSRQEAVANPNDPVRITKAIQDQENLVMQKADEYSPERLKLEMGNVRSKTHASVVEQLVNSDQDHTARAYFEQIKGEISNPEDLARTEKLVKAGTLDGESRRISDEILSKTSNLTLARKEAEKIGDAELYDKTVKRIEQKLQDRQTDRQYAERENYDKASDIVERSGGDLSLLPQTMRVAMSNEQNNALEARAAQIRKGVEPPPNGEKYYEFTRMAGLAAAGNEQVRNSFLQENLRQYAHVMPPNELKELIKTQADLQKGNSSKELGDIRSKTQVVNSVLAGVGIDPNAKEGSRDAKKAKEFWFALEDRARSEGQAKGKSLDNNELQNLAEDLVVRGTVAGQEHSFTIGNNTVKYPWFSSKKRAFEAETGQQIVVEYDDIPGSRRKQIENELRSRKIPVNESTVTALYNRIANPRKTN